MLASFLVGLAGLIPQETAATPEFWFGLEAGPLAVGFESRWVLDPARTWRTAYDGGATYGGAEGAARPVLVLSWYPAEDAFADVPPDERMPYGEYLDVPVDPPEVADLSCALVEYAEGVIAQELFGKRRDAFGDDEERAWERLRSTRTACLRDAEPAAGPFPLVLYHSGAGSSFEDDATLCELLASHGYVVLASAYFHEDGSSLGTDGGAGSVRDLQFLHAWAQDLAFADRSRTALVGHSLGAQAALRALATPGTRATAAVLLDTTQDYYTLPVPTFGYLVEPVLAGRDHVRQDLLVVAGPEAIFDLCDRLTSARRDYLTVPLLGHNEFISQGLQTLRVAEWRVDSGGRDTGPFAAEHRPVLTHYVTLVRTVLRYLDAELKDDAAAWAMDVAGLEARGFRPDAISLQPVARGEGAPDPADAAAPPTPRQFLALVRHAPIERVTAMLAGLEGQDTPLTESTMLAGSLLMDLVAADRVDDARKLLAADQAIGVDALSMFRFLAGFAPAPAARALVDAALRIVPDDPDLLQRRAQLGR